MRVARGIAQQHVRRAGKRGAIGRLSAQRRLRRRIPPRLVRDAAQSQPRFFDPPALELVVQIGELLGLSGVDLGYEEALELPGALRIER